MESTCRNQITGGGPLEAMHSPLPMAPLCFEIYGIVNMLSTRMSPAPSFFFYHTKDCIATGSLTLLKLFLADIAKFCGHSIEK